MNLMGIDLGVHKIAMVVYCQDDPVHWMAYEAPVSDPRDVQLHQLGLMAYNTGYVHEVDSVWIEDTIIGNNRKYSIRLAETKGAVLSDLAHLRLARGADIRLVDNKAWKKVVVGNGNATKEDIKDYIHVTHPAYAPFCGDDQDLYDAACIGRYGLHITAQAAHLQL